MNEIRKLHLYTGTGKGKTTAAMGLALRALGHGERALIAQFLKDGRSGELKAFERFENAVLWPGETVKTFVFRMTPQQREEARAGQTRQAQALAEAIAAKKPELIVLDELAVALALGMVDEPAARALLDAALQSGETVVTGRTAPGWLEARADYVSVITAKRHPYETEGLTARRGVEW